MTKPYETQYCIELYQKLHWVCWLQEFIHDVSNMNKKEITNLSEKMEEEIEQLVFA